VRSTGGRIPPSRALVRRVAEARYPRLRGGQRRRGPGCACLQAKQQLDCHAALDEEQGLVVLIASMTQQRRREGDIAKLTTCPLLKLCIGNDVAQTLLKRSTVPRRGVVASIAHDRFSDGERPEQPALDQRLQM
jgi:hypothetical protein